MKKRVSAAIPVQVYLAPRERDRLDRLVDQLETTKSDVLRRGIEALERQLVDPRAHPALRLIGIATEPGRKRAVDVARNHDRVLADEEEQSWGHRPEGKGSGGR